MESGVGEPAPRAGAAQFGTERARVLVVDPFDQDALADLQTRHEVRVRLQPEPEELRRLLADSDAVVLRSGVRLTADTIAAAPQLRVIARAGTGLDNIDVSAARAAGIAVCRVPEASASSVAEFAIGLALAVARRIPEADRQVRSGEGDKAGLVGLDLHGRTLGVVGLGAVGRRIAELGSRLGMSVLGCVQRSSPERARELAADGIALADLPTLLGQADVLCLAVPLTDATWHLIDAEALDRMKPGSMLVNVARGGVVDEEALLYALQRGSLAGAALDVRQHEDRETPLAELPNVVVTPHIGAMSLDAQQRIGRITVESLEVVLSGGRAPYQVC